MTPFCDLFCGQWKPCGIGCFGCLEVSWLFLSSLESSSVLRCRNTIGKHARQRNFAPLTAQLNNQRKITWTRSWAQVVLCHWSQAPKTYQQNFTHSPLRERTPTLHTHSGDSLKVTVSHQPEHNGWHLTTGQKSKLFYWVNGSLEQRQVTVLPSVDNRPQMCTASMVASDS